MQPLTTNLESNPAECHHRCFACGNNRVGLQLQFALDGKAGVVAEWKCSEDYSSYPGIIHGGIVATLLNAAMTNCLLLRGVSAVTAELNIRYRAPLRVGGCATVRASIVRARPPMYILSAEAVQDGGIVAIASGKFMMAER